MLDLLRRRNGAVWLVFVPRAVRFGINGSRGQGVRFAWLGAAPYMLPRHLCLGPRPPTGDSSPLQGTYPSQAAFSHRCAAVRSHYRQNGPGAEAAEANPAKDCRASSIRENPRNPRQNACFLPRIARIFTDFRIGKSNSRTTPTRRPFPTRERAAVVLSLPSPRGQMPRLLEDAGGYFRPVETASLGHTAGVSGTNRG